MIRMWISRSSARTMMMLFVLCLTGTAYSQDDQAAALVLSNAIKAPTVHVQVEEVHLSLVVTNRWGHFVRNLRPLDFTIQDNDVKAERITHFETAAALPLQIAMVIDNSDSMNAYLDVEKRSAITFFDDVLKGQQDQALVIAFNENVQLLQNATRDSKSLSATIRNLKSNGQTAIYDAIWMASEELARLSAVPLSRRAIVLITDGDDNRSHISRAQAQEIALRNDTVIYVVSTNVALDDESRSNDKVMKELAESTGGTLLHASSASELNRSFEKVERDLRSQYAVAYKPPTSGTGPDGSFHRLIIRGPKNLRVRYRNGYYAK